MQQLLKKSNFQVSNLQPLAHHHIKEVFEIVDGRTVDILERPLEKCRPKPNNFQNSRLNSGYLET